MWLTCWEAGVVGLQEFEDADAGIRGTNDICVDLAHLPAITPLGITVSVMYVVYIT